MPDIDTSDSPAERDHSELEALVDLIGSDGWQRYVAHVDSEWGAVAYARKLDAAMATARSADRSAELDIYEIGAAMRAAQMAALWPITRIGQLREKKKPAGMFGRQRRA